MSELPMVRAALIWLLIALLAIANGIVRENIIAPLTGIRIALPLSGISLSVIVLLVSWFSLGFLGVFKAKVYLLIGVQWVVMTLAFEFLFGHYVAGKSWAELLQTFNVARGDLFLLVLLVSFFSPYLVARFKGIVG